MSNGTELHVAASAGDIPALKLLLAQGSSVDSRDGNGATPLFAAAFNGQLEAIELLLQNGAEVNAGNQVNYTSLMAAAREKKVKVVTALLKAKADPEIKAQSGMKAIHWAMLDTVPNTKGRRGQTESIVIEILDAFRQNGADLNAKSQSCSTPLMDAAWWGLADVTAYLLRHGANPNETDGNGEKAEDYAKKKMAKNLGEDMNSACLKILDLLKGGSAEKPWWKII
jgi:ankyrin repeat protein